MRIKYTYNLSSFSVLNFIFPSYRINFLEGARFVYKAEKSYPNASLFNLGSVDIFRGGGGGGVHERGWEKKHYNNIFINLKLKFSVSFSNECRQQINVSPKPQVCLVTLANLYLKHYTLHFGDYINISVEEIIAFSSIIRLLYPLHCLLYVDKIYCLINLLGSAITTSIE
jgi:hypothetical protein